jgi:hypothetical protein
VNYSKITITPKSPIKKYKSILKSFLGPEATSLLPSIGLISGLHRFANAWYINGGKNPNPARDLELCTLNIELPAKSAEELLVMIKFEFSTLKISDLKGITDLLDFE